MTTRDDDVLTELGAALDVRVPAGFEARVMRRVHQGAQRSTWPWMATALTVAAALVMAFFTLPSRSAPAVDRPIAADTSDLAATSSLAHPAPARQSVDAYGLTSSRLRRADVIAPAAARRPTVAEVLVPDDQARRFHALVEAVAAGQVVIAPPRRAPETEIQSLLLAPTSPVVIQAMAITPLSEDVSQTEWR